MSETGPDPDCQDCAQVSPRVVAATVAFALFAAYIAADFASGGRVTGWVLALLTASRGQVPRDSTVTQ